MACNSVGRGTLLRKLTLLIGRSTLIMNVILCFLLAVSSARATCFTSNGFADGCYAGAFCCYGDGGEFCDPCGSIQVSCDCAGEYTCDSFVGFYSVRCVAYSSSGD